MATCWHQRFGAAGAAGAVRLGVGGVLTVAGQLTANGESAWWSGGAGGSILVSAGTLAGAGTISAKGGDCGYAMSGGGGGGRIAMYYGSSSFSGALSAAGGLTPANAFGGLNGCCGGAGTLYTKANSQSVGDLLLDNSGRTNAVKTLITAPVAYRLTLTNATAYVTAPLTLTGLRVSANGLLTHPFQGPRLQVLVQGNAVVEGGGAIAADARGYPGDTGPGKGSQLGGYYWNGSGAGHGGQGGACGHGGGGVTYDSETEPVDFGSGGGGGPASNCGGGAIQLTVAGTLTIDGRVSVNNDGVTGGYNGGGSGGSVWLTASRLDGAGTITANGQAASYVAAGGGGGGRIALYYGSSTFSGGLTALGGLSEGAFGATSGAAGSLYYSTSVSPPMVIAQYPSGSANRFVSYVDVTFNQAVDPDTFTTNDVIVTTPAGPIPASQITLSGGGGVTWRIGFPTQMANGAYSFTVGPHIANLFGQEMAASYSGGFTLNFTTPSATASQTGRNVSLIWSSATGLSYQLQSATNLPAASWLNEGAPLNGTGGLLTNSLPTGAQPGKFFRLLLLEN